VKEKIRALNSKTVANGCTEAEALAAMAMVGKLLEQYNLSMDEVSLREDGCVCIAIDLGGKRISAITRTIVGISALTGTQTWQGTVWGKTAELCGLPGDHLNRNQHVFFFGTPTDAEAARHLWNVIVAAHETELAAYKLSDEYANFDAPENWSVRSHGITRRSLSSSFSHGMADRLIERLVVMAKESRETVKEEEAAGRAAHIMTGRSLIVLKQELVEQEWKKTGIKLSSGSSAGATSSSAYGAGKAAGGRVNLGRSTALIGRM
jgi:hypothetical protein